MEQLASTTGPEEYSPSDAYLRSQTIKQVAAWVKSSAVLMVSNPSAVRIFANQVDDTHTQLRLIVADSDTGAVIGAKGRNARSLRTMLIAVSGKCRHKFELQIAECNAWPRSTESTQN